MGPMPYILQLLWDTQRSSVNKHDFLRCKWKKQVMEMLIEHGANVNAQHKFAKSTALHFAAEMGLV